MTDMDTAAGEGLRRRRGGGREGHARNAAPQQPPWAQPRMRYRPTELLSADELESIHTGSLRVLSEIGMDFLDADAREVLRAAGATVAPDSQRVRFDPDDGHRADQDRAGTVHAPRPEPRLRRPAGRRLDRLRDRRQPAERGRPRPRPAGREPGRLPEPAAPGPVAQRRPFPVRLSRGAGRPPPRRPPPVGQLRRPDSDGQGGPLLQPRPPAEHRCPRDGPHRPRCRPGDDRPRAVGLHGRQFQLAAAPRRTDAPGDHGVRGAQPGRVHHAVHAGRCDGPGDPRRRAGRAERRGAGRDGPDPGRQPGRAGHLRRLHLERRHAVGRARVRDPGVHADGDDRRPAGAALRRPVSLVQRVRRQRARRPGRLRIGVLAVGRDPWAASTC